MVFGIPSSEPVSIIHPPSLSLACELQRIPPSRPTQLDCSQLETLFMRHLPPEIAEQTGARSHSHQSVAA